MLRFVRRRYRMIRDPSDFTQVAVTGTHPQAIRMREKLERRRVPLNHEDVYGRSWDRTSDLPRVKRALSR